MDNRKGKAEHRNRLGKDNDIKQSASPFFRLVLFLSDSLPSQVVTTWYVDLATRFLKSNSTFLLARSAMATSSVISPFQSTLQLLKFSTPTETYVSPYSVQPLPSATCNDSNSSMIWETKNGSGVVHASTVPMIGTEQDSNSGMKCRDRCKGFTENTNFKIGSISSLSISTANTEQSIDQCLDYALGNSSDNGLDSIDVLSRSRFEPNHGIAQPSTWNTSATDTMDNNTLSYGLSMPKDACRTSWSSISIGLAIRGRKSVVLDGEKYWIVEWERSYIHESETFGVHWNLFVDHEAKTSMLESKHLEVSKRKPGRLRKSASSRFSKRSTTMKSRKPS